MERWDRSVREFVWFTAGMAAVFFLVSLLVSGDLWAPSLSSVLLALAFIGVTVATEQFPLHLADKTKLYVDTAVLTATALCFGVPGAMLVAAVSVAVHETLLRDSWEEAVFNSAQTALYVGLGSAVLHLLADLPIGLRLPNVGNAVAIGGAIVTMHLVNTWLVATIGALQMGARPFRLWRQGLWIDLPEHLALVVMGMLLAELAVERPWAMLVFAVPVGLVYVSLRRNVDVHAATQATMETLAEILDLRDPATAGHSRRVAERTLHLTERMEISPLIADRIVAAARVHDVGSWETGARANGQSLPVPNVHVLTRVPIYAVGMRDIHHLHERWDGAGVPDGLAGEAIPLGARVISVANAFDELTTGVNAKPPRAALWELRNGAGRQWDPRVVQFMVDVVDEELAHLENEARAAALQPVGQRLPAPVAARQA